MNSRFNLIVFFIVLVAFATARPLSPSVSIRYDDILSGMTPSSSIGIMLGIDENRYTGFDTDTDGNNMRLIVGWKWTVIGLGTVKDADENVYAQYTFGGRYELMKNLFTGQVVINLYKGTIGKAQVSKTLKPEELAKNDSKFLY